MDYKETRALLEKYLAGNSSLKEEASLRAFFTENSEFPPDLMYAKALFAHYKSDSEVQYHSIVKTPKRYIIAKISAIAAGIIIILGVSFSILSSTNITHYLSRFGGTISVSNESSDSKKVLLPDNTIIWLNTDTQVIYPKKLNYENNTIVIKGEAFFEFSEGENITYKIVAHNALIETQSPASLNIRDLPDQESVEIAVKSGAVRVSEKGHTNGLTMLVTEGNYCSVHKYQKLIFAATNKNENYIAWKTGNLVFENSYMATVTDALSRYYNINIRFEDNQLAYCKFSGAFENKSIAYILKQIGNELNFEIEQTAKIITLYGDGCKTY